MKQTLCEKSVQLFVIPSIFEIIYRYFISYNRFFLIGPYFLWNQTQVNSSPIKNYSTTTKFQQKSVFGWLTKSEVTVMCPTQLHCIAPGPHDIAVVKFFPKIWVVKRAASQPAIDRKPEFPIGILTDDVGNVLFQNNRAVGTRGQGGDPTLPPRFWQIS